jgi:hypothetical protein
VSTNSQEHQGASRAEIPSGVQYVEDKIRSTVEAANVPISFYARFVDQNESPVSEVRAVLSTRRWLQPATGQGKAAFEKAELLSDKDGLIVFEGGSGDSLAIETIQREGYVVSTRAPRGFGFSGPEFYNADRSQPVIIRLWKLGDSANLVTQDRDIRIPYDGTPVVFDLLTGQKVTSLGASGDLRVTLVREPLTIPLGHRERFSWRAEIEAINGGVIQSDDEFMYAAPASGYEPRMEINMPQNATNWTSTYGVSFYAKTRGGSAYSRVRFEFRVNSDKPQTGFTITSATNPNGSRNLQP